MNCLDGVLCCEISEKENESYGYRENVRFVEGNFRSLLYEFSVPSSESLSLLLS